MRLIDSWREIASASGIDRAMTESSDGLTAFAATNARGFQVRFPAPSITAHHGSLRVYAASFHHFPPVPRGLS